VTRGTDFVARSNRLLLPVGLPLAVAVGLLLPAAGSALGGVRVGSFSWNDIAVVIIFLVVGLTTELASGHDRSLLAAGVKVLAVNLVLAPVLGAAALAVFDLPLGVALGLVVMVSVPTTLSSAAVIAINVGGDRVWALTLTVVCVLVGAFTAPVAVSLLLSTENVDLSPWPILADVLRVVLLPAVVGALLRRFLLPDPPRWLGTVPSLMVLSVVWVTMSEQAATARSMEPVLLLLMLVVAVVGHGALLAAAAALIRSMPTEHAMPVLFVASQKTLPVALTVLVLLGQEVPQVEELLAVATIACVVWHFTQLFADSLLADRIAVAHAAGR
jgi:sodium/bile acid cotransporter 7